MHHNLEIIVLVDLLLNILVFDYLHLKAVKKKKKHKVGYGPRPLHTYIRDVKLGLHVRSEQLEWVLVPKTVFCMWDMFT